MCAQYTVRNNLSGLNISYVDEFFEEATEVQHRILPYQPAPVLVARKGAPQAALEPMVFSMTPSWSRERRPKFATHNARIEDITAKPTWTGPFKNSHCIVPMSTFIEPIYENENAGFMVAFKALQGGPLLAAGIWSTWTEVATGEVLESFAIITTEPLEFVKKVGHDRSPLFLSESDAEIWLSNAGEPAKDLQDYLLRNQNKPELGFERDRPIRSYWKKLGLPVPSDEPPPQGELF